MCISETAFKKLKAFKNFLQSKGRGVRGIERAKPQWIVKDEIETGRRRRARCVRGQRGWPETRRARSTPNAGSRDGEPDANRQRAAVPGWGRAVGPETRRTRQPSDGVTPDAVAGGRRHAAHTLGPPPRSERGRTAGEARTRLTSDPPPGLTRRRAERRAVARPGSPELSNACWVVTSAHVLVLGGRVDTWTPRRLASLTCQAREMP